MDREPVLIILAGLAALVSAALAATNAIGWTHLSVGETSSLIAFVVMLCGLLAAAIRGQVYSPATYTAGVNRAMDARPAGRPPIVNAAITDAADPPYGQVLPVTIETIDKAYDEDQEPEVTP